MIGAGPASLTVARDLAPLGYEITLFDGDAKAGGMIRSQIPRFRLPESVIDEEVGYITGLGMTLRLGERIDSLKALLAEGYDAIFVGSGAPRGRDLDLPGREEARANIHIGIDWLSQRLLRPHRQDRPARDRAGRRQHRHGLLPHLAPAGRRGRQGHRPLRLRGDEGLALGEGGRDARGHPDPQLPRAQGLHPRERQADRRDLRGGRRPRSTTRAAASWSPPGEPDEHYECDDVLVAVGQENAFPWMERDIGMEFDEWEMPKVDPITMQSTIPNVFFGGDAAFGPKNIIWAVAHGHDAAVSIDKFCQGEDVSVRPPPEFSLVSQKMGIHEWSYDNDIANDRRYRVPLRDKAVALKDVRMEVELGFDRDDRLQGGRALPELRRPDGVRRQPVHRVRRLRGHLSGRLHHLHARNATRLSCAWS